jgi:hypothetical protein
MGHSVVSLLAHRPTLHLGSIVLVFLDSRIGLEVISAQSPLFFRITHGTVLGIDIHPLKLRYQLTPIPAGDHLALICICSQFEWRPLYSFGALVSCIGHGGTLFRCVGL